MKRITSACLEQTLIFDSREELEAYRRQMEKKRVPFEVESVEELSGGQVCARAKRRYVHYPVGDYMK